MFCKLIILIHIFDHADLECEPQNSFQVTKGTFQGPRSKFSSGGAKEECVKENFFGGGMLVDFYSISLK